MDDTKKNSESVSIVAKLVTASEKFKTIAAVDMSVFLMLGNKPLLGEGDYDNGNIEII